MSCPSGILTEKVNCTELREFDCGTQEVGSVVVLPAIEASVAPVNTFADVPTL